MLDATDLLTRAVTLKSVSGDEAEVARFLVEQLESFCDEAFVDAAGNAVGKLGRGPLKVHRARARATHLRRILNPTLSSSAN